MSKLLIAGVFMVFSATAGAGETGIINQAGPYEATMRFYLHPAHGFPGKAPTTEQGDAVANAKKPSTQASREPEGRPQAASQASSAQPDRAQVTTGGHT